MNDFIKLEHMRGIQYIRVSKISGITPGDNGNTRIWAEEDNPYETPESMEDVMFKIRNAPK